MAAIAGMAMVCSACCGTDAAPCAGPAAAPGPTPAVASAAVTPPAASAPPTPTVPPTVAPPVATTPPAARATKGDRRFCEFAITASLERRCDAAELALGRCVGPKRAVAADNVNHCRGH